MTPTIYKGPERRNASECPLTAEQAYQILHRLEQSISVNKEILAECQCLKKRITSLERYTVAGRAVFWTLTVTGGVLAWTSGIVHDIREFFRS